MSRAGKFYVQWWDGHQSKHLSLGTANREEAKRALRQFLAGLDTPEPPKSPTIGEILAGYVQDREGRVRSIASIRYACAALAEHLGDMTPDQITTRSSRNYADARRAQGRRAATGHGKPLSDGTIIREVVTLRAALRWAVDERWIERAPRVEAPSAPPPKERWLTYSEARRLLDVTETLHLRLFIQLALYTGARTSAILELQWQQVDFERSTINYGTGNGNSVDMIERVYGHHSPDWLRRAAEALSG